MNKRIIPGISGLLLVVLLLIFSALPVLAADSVAVTADKDTGQVKVTVENSDWVGSEISLICYKPGGSGGDLALSRIGYLDQYSVTEASQVIQFKINEQPTDGEYTLLIGSKTGKSTTTFTFDDGGVKPQQVTVTYKAGSGGKIQGSASQKINKGESTREVTAVADSGYKFIKWSDGKTTAKRQETNVQKDMTLTATFQKTTPPVPGKKYTVTLNPNGGRVSPTAISVEAGKTIGQIPNPSRSKYAFKGWFTQKTGGTAVTAATKVNANMTIYARWEQISPAKGYKFTGGSLKYKVTKKATAKTYGDVEVIGAARKSVTKITIPSAVKTGDYRYKVTVVGRKAFANYKKLKTVSIGKNVKTIKSRAFYGCKKLSKVTIGSAVQKIESRAFYNAKALKSIRINSKRLKTVQTYAFKNIHKKAVIRVPSSKLKTYRKLLKGKGQKSTVTIKKK